MLCIESHNGEVSLITTLKQTLPECFYILLLDSTGIGILGLNFHKIILYDRQFCLTTGEDQELIKTSQGRQMVIYRLGTVNIIILMFNLFVSHFPEQRRVNKHQKIVELILSQILCYFWDI